MTTRTLRPRRSPSRPRSPERRSGRLVTAQDVRDAAERLRGVAVRTPLRYVEPLAAYLKLENLQPMGAFKIRGAYNAISRIPQAVRRQGVMTYSSGNHGQAAAGSAARVWGVEPAGAPKLARSLAAGRPVRLERTASLADGLITLSVGDIPFAQLARYRDHLAGVALVEDDALRDAVHFLWRECRVAVEPSGAATTAALRSGAVRPVPPTVLVVSGGNVDPALLED